MISTWVDFNAVKQAISMEMAIAHYGVVLRRIHGPYLRGGCPLPSHTSKGSTQSLIVNIEKNAWACHSDSCAASRSGRSGGNVLDFVAAMENCSVRDAALKLQEWFTVGARVPNGHAVYAAVAVSNSAGTEAVENKPLGFTLQGVDPYHPYLTGRGVDSQTSGRFGIGFYPGKGLMEGRIIIPIHNEHGVLVAYAGRTLGQGEPRYRFPAHFRKSLVLYNLHRASRHGKIVIVVEGFFDCVKLHQAGFPCVVALMGSSLSQRQEDLLPRYFREAVLMLDGDEPGRHATDTIGARLATRLPVRIAAVPLDLQPDELSQDEIRRLLQS